MTREQQLLCIFHPRLEILRINGDLRSEVAPTARAKSFTSCVLMHKCTEYTSIPRGPLCYRGLQSASQAVLLANATVE